MAVFIHKNKQEFKLRAVPQPVATVQEDTNKKEKTSKDMTTQEKVELANQVLGTTPKVKRIKGDKGLIERAEVNKTILMEDNRELLID
jgi:hypothetical protein